MTENQLLTTDEEDELYEHHRIVVDRGQTLMRIDQYLKHHLSNVTRTKLQNAIETESVRVNEKAVKSSYKVKPFDIITVSMPHPPRETDIVAENIPLNIVYEDDEVLVLNKPAGMVVHPAYGNWSGTVVNALVYHFQHLPTGRNGEARPGLVHRIDKDTSGLLVIAKTEYAMAHIARQFFEHTTERTYQALVWGEPKETAGTIVGHVGRSARDRKVMDVYEDGSQGKHAVTHYKVLKSFKYTSLVQCNLETGRTHQIRAHFQHIGHPLFSDSVYGGDKVLRGTTSGSYRAFVENCFQLMPRQALHAKSLGFEHPRTKQWMQFESELPEDFMAVLAKWEKFAAE
ncbi:RluA family pseudouridine synthase [Runella salmonicolor]|uniref:Pseudouridine synthase n=1 Tax=Runella salmonicolor TaxID=2950278 RepID=A0ABT1FNJ9_9BACT|nr:RluA family pseudouridine synthase [Runella salmonicolor]MCP1382097.1 RluA family pseudouridine synthase [Runella salmonicolor]